MRLDRYSVEMNGASRLTYDGTAAGPISAIIECVRIGPAPAGEYRAVVSWRAVVWRDNGWHADKVKSGGAVMVNADGSLTIGARWGLATPTEPIDRADLGIDVGVPNV